MADTTLNQFRSIFPMAPLTEGMGSVFESGNVFCHTCLAVVTGFAFFYFLAFDIGQPFALSGLAVVAGLALQPSLVGAMRKIGGFGGLGRINR